MLIIPLRSNVRLLIKYINTPFTEIILSQNIKLCKICNKPIECDLCVTHKNSSIFYIKQFD